jgi:hypothetical protein
VPALLTGVPLAEVEVPCREVALRVGADAAPVAGHPAGRVAAETVGVVPVDHGPVPADTAPQHEAGQVVEPEAAVDEHATVAAVPLEVVDRVPPHDQFSKG